MSRTVAVSELRMVTQRRRGSVATGDIVQHGATLAKVSAVNPRARTVQLETLKVKGGDVDKVKKAYSAFHHVEPRYLTPARMKTPGLVYELGELEGVIYRASVRGKVASYMHPFRKSSRPRLAVDGEGTQLYIVGGRYRVGERGIEDK